MMENNLGLVRQDKEVDKLSEAYKQFNRKIADNYKDQLHILTRATSNAQKLALDFGVVAADEWFEYAKAFRKGLFGA